MKQVSAVFWIGMAIAGIFVVWGVINPENLIGAMENIQYFLLDVFGWFYQFSATLFVLLALFLVFSRYGRIRLGDDDDKPEYSRPTWVAMLFSAGMGIGLLFYGVSEPVSHFAYPPYGPEGTPEAAKLALRYTYLNWGLHAWAIYAVTGLSLAYYKFRKKAPGLMSATLYPVLGDKTKGPVGMAIDLVAVFATVFGVAASLGLGAAQINSGLSFLIGIPNAFWIQLIIIILTTALFILSASTGIKRGIKYLSNANMTIAVILFGLFFAVGPIGFILDLLTTTVGEYIQYLPSMGLRMAPFNAEHADWLRDWTIFFMAWWIAWSPFVGTFIARVSKGRTVREFMIAVLMVPTTVCIIWFAVFGGTGIYFDLYQGTGIAGQTLETALFYTFQQLPLSGIMSAIAVLLIATFFITSADSATFVLGMQTTNGSLNPPNFVKISWGLFLAASAIILMGSGGLNGLQTAIIVSAFPLTFILYLMSYSLLRSFRREIGRERRLIKKLLKKRV